MKVAKTSLKAFNKNSDELESLKEKVHAELQAFYIEHRFWPTYNELHRFMMRRNETINFNTQIQPRLTNDLVKQNRVRRNGERKCKISDQEIATWKVIH
jgi:hypothetical protein